MNFYSLAAVVLSGGVVVACATDHGARAPTGAATAVISLQDINCQSCGATSVMTLKQEPGVRDATFDRDSAEVTVSYDESAVTPTALIAVIADLGFRAQLGAGHGRYAPDVEFEAAMDVAVISKNGEAVALEPHLVAGKITVVDFYATWCGPCRDVDREMYETLMKRDDVALRKLNVVDWESAVAKTYLKDVPQLPYVIVFDREGQRVDAIAGLDLDRLRAALEDAS